MGELLYNEKGQNPIERDGLGQSHTSIHMENAVEIDTHKMAENLEGHNDNQIRENFHNFNSHMMTSTERSSENMFS